MENEFNIKVTVFLLEIIQRALSDFKRQKEQWIHLYSTHKFIKIKLCCTPDNLNLNVVSLCATMIQILTYNDSL